MAGAAQHMVIDFSHRGRPFWLPATGWGNGLDDESWAAIVDVRSEYAADLILLELRRAGVPGYAAPVRPPRPRTRHQDPGTERVRIWVGCRAFGTGETTILHALPELAAHLGGSVLA